MSLQVGIVGAGMMGAAHAQAYQQAGIALKGIADVNYGSASQLAEQLGCGAYSSMAELLAVGVDAVSICLPHHLHREAALLAAKQGAHVLIEKPLAVSLNDARAIIDTCQANDVRLMVGFTHRFLSTFQELRSLIADSVFGKINLVVDNLAAGGAWLKLPAWYLDRAKAGGGIMMIGTSHSVDRIRWLIGSEVDTVFAAIRQTGTEGNVEDVGSATLTYQNGTIASVVGYRSPLASHRRRHSLEIYGTLAEASITLSQTNEQIMEITDQQGTRTVIATDDNPFLKEVQEFVASITEGRPPSPSGEDGLVSLATLLAMYESSDSGTLVRMSYL